MGVRDGEGALLDRRHVKISLACIQVNARISSNREKLAHPYFLPVAKQILDATSRSRGCSSLVVEEHKLTSEKREVHSTIQFGPDSCACVLSDPDP